MLRLDPLLRKARLKSAESESASSHMTTEMRGEDEGEKPTRTPEEEFKAREEEEFKLFVSVIGNGAANKLAQQTASGETISSIPVQTQIAPPGPVHASRITRVSSPLGKAVIYYTQEIGLPVEKAVLRAERFIRDVTALGYITNGHIGTDAVRTAVVSSGVSNGVIGYCVKCKEKREISNAERITMKNGKKAVKGKCPHCETVMFRIG